VDRIVALLFDPVFWFTAILIGTLVSVFGNFATDGVKSLLGRVSAGQRARNERERQRIYDIAKIYASSPSLMSVLSSEIAYYSYRSILALIFAMSLLIMFTLLIIAIRILGWLALSQEEIKAVVGSDIWSSWLQSLRPDQAATTIANSSVARLLFAILPLIPFGLYAALTLYHGQQLTKRMRILRQAKRIVYDQLKASAPPDPQTP
jgi:hypothetical protein